MKTEQLSHDRGENSILSQAESGCHTSGTESYFPFFFVLNQDIGTILQLTCSRLFLSTEVF